MDVGLEVPQHLCLAGWTRVAPLELHQASPSAKVLDPAELVGHVLDGGSETGVIDRDRQHRAGDDGGLVRPLVDLGGGAAAAVTSAGAADEGKGGSVPS